MLSNDELEKLDEKIINPLGDAISLAEAKAVITQARRANELEAQVAALVGALGSHWFEDHTSYPDGVKCVYNLEAWENIKRLQKDLTTAAQQHDDARRAEGAKAVLDHYQNGNRPIMMDRDALGRKVREAWVRWAQEQPSPKPSWLLPYDDLNEADKEADRRIGEEIGRWVLLADAASTVFQFQAIQKEGE